MAPGPAQASAAVLVAFALAPAAWLAAQVPPEQGPLTRAIGPLGPWIEAWWHTLQLVAGVFLVGVSFGASVICRFPWLVCRAPSSNVQLQPNLGADEHFGDDRTGDNGPAARRLAPPTHPGLLDDLGAR